MHDLLESGENQVCLIPLLPSRNVLIKMRCPGRDLVWGKNQPMGRKQALLKGVLKFGSQLLVEFVEELSWMLSQSLFSLNEPSREDRSDVKLGVTAGADKGWNIAQEELGALKGETETNGM